MQSLNEAYLLLTRDRRPGPPDLAGPLASQHHLRASTATSPCRQVNACSGARSGAGHGIVCSAATADEGAVPLLAWVHQGHRGIDPARDRVVYAPLSDAISMLRL